MPRRKGKPAQTDAKMKKLNFFCVWVLTNAIGLCIIVKLNQFTPFATVAQQVEQLTRNEQVVRSNRISSSNKSPESIRIPGFCYFSLQFFQISAPHCGKQSRRRREQTAHRPIQPRCRTANANRCRDPVLSKHFLFAISAQRVIHRQVQLLHFICLRFGDTDGHIAKRR